MKSKTSSRVWVSPDRWKVLAPILIPTAVIVALMLGVTATLVLLTHSINLQVESGTKVLNYNLSDQSRVFVQLQRESLKMIIVLGDPDTAQDYDAVRLQSDLLASRINYTNLSTLEDQSVTPTSVYENTQQIIAQWSVLSPNLELLLTDLGDEALRQTVMDELHEFEILANGTEIDYSRGRNTTLASFAEASRQIPQTFTSVTLILLVAMGTVLIGLYVYIRQVQRAEAARQSNQFKDQFLAVMSHELRTPLNAMIGFLGIIKMGGGLPEKTAYMVDRVRDNAERLLVLINDILDLSKLEAKRFEIHNEAVEIKDLATRWTTQTDVLAAQKDLSFRVDIDPELPRVIYTDSDALTKIVVNLLSNAFKFTKKGEVGLAMIRRDPTTWEISITDTGIGIAEDKQKLVFESFQQVDSSTRRSYGGTGLGLSIVKSLTALMKGTVSLKSEPNVGSTFTVALPLLTVPRDEAGLASSTPTLNKGT